MPWLMSSSRPTAFRRGPMKNPRSEATRAWPGRASSISALMPGRRRPWFMRARPRATRMRLMGVELHHVGDGAQGDQVEALGQVRAGAVGEPAVGPEARAQRDQRVVHHPHARQVLRRKGAARLVGVHQGFGGWQVVAGQVVVGDDHWQTGGMGGRHAGQRVDAVVDGEDDLRPLRPRGLDEQRRQAIAHRHAVGHDEVHGRPHGAQARDGERGAGRSVGVVVAGDDDLPTSLQGRRQMLDGGVHALQPRPAGAGRPGPDSGLPARRIPRWL